MLPSYFSFLRAVGVEGGLQARLAKSLAGIPPRCLGGCGDCGHLQGAESRHIDSHQSPAHLDEGGAHAPNRRGLAGGAAEGVPKRGGLGTREWLESSTRAEAEATSQTVTASLTTILIQRRDLEKRAGKSPHFSARGTAPGLDLNSPLLVADRPGASAVKRGPYVPCLRDQGAISWSWMMT